MISGDADGTESVRLYGDAGGGPVQYGAHDGYTALLFKVDNDFSADSVNNYNTDDIVGGVKETWPQVVEEAYGEYLGGDSCLYQGGIDAEVMEALTGKDAYYQDIDGLKKGELYRLQHYAGAITTFDTPDDDNLPHNLIGDHAYMFDGLVDQGGRTYVSLINPWGDHQPDLIPASELKQDFTGITHGNV